MKASTGVIIFLAHMLLASTYLHAEMEPIQKIKAGIPPFQIIKDIMRHNANTGASPQPETAGPLVTWLADPDERINANMLLPGKAGAVYSVRNTANQFILGAGAIDYGVQHLWTPLLLITGNTDSRAFALLLKGYPKTDLGKELDNLRATIEFPAGLEMTDEERRHAMVLMIEKNIDHQVGQCQKRYAERILAGRLAVVGAVIDLDNSYGLGINRMIITNINGDTDPESIARRPEAMTLGVEYRQAIQRYQGIPK